MIQRIQSVWLLLVVICAFLFIQIPLYIADLADGTTRTYSATENLLLFAVGALTGLLALAAIFLFKKRPLQLKLTYLGILGSIILIAVEVWQLSLFKAENDLNVGNYHWGSLFPILMLVFFILAARGIKRDEKLIKSLDRLR